MHLRTLAAALTLAVLLAGCATGTPAPPASSGSASPTPSAGTASQSASQLPSLAVTGAVTRDLTAPWDLAFLPDGSALVSERDSARVLRVPAGGGPAREVGRVDGVVAGGEGGLLGIALEPAGDPTYLMAYFTAADDNRVVRITWDGERLGAARTVLDGIPKGGIHNGGRLRFGPDGFLYVPTGDTADRASAQDRESLAGKILRITVDGEPAPGNPWEGSPVWSMGHRNVQGLAFDSQDRLWASEFGQDDWDELNLVRPGKNYGWPVHEGRADDPAYVDPQATWPPAEASPSGIAVVDDVVYVAALRGRRLWQVPAPDGRAGKPRAWFTEEYGRLRAVAQAPDGALWVLTNNTDGRGDPQPGDDRILRVELR